MYLDSSALVEVHVREAGREIVQKAVDESSRIATVVISCAELRAAFARLLREQGLTEEEHEGPPTHSKRGGGRTKRPPSPTI